MLFRLRRKILSQNFIYNRKLIKQLVRGSFIGFQDIVLEIGPGKGFITSELLQIAKKVLAVELDQKLILHLKRFFGNNTKLELYWANFLDFSLPNYPYKVFANIPFSIEGKIIRKLIDSNNPPDECYLVVRKDLAERLSGRFKDNQFSLIHKPWFNFENYYYFKKSDFIPNATMDCVMLRFTKRETPLIPLEEKEFYQKFIELAFGNGAAIKQNLRKQLNTSQIQKIEQKLNFSLKVSPTKLSFEQWLNLYHGFK